MAENQARRDLEIGSTVLQQVLPMWDEESRGVPNPFIRSGVFSVGQEKARPFRDNEQVVSLSNYQIRVTGKELYQDDLSVWMSLICLARTGPISDVVRFTGYWLIKDLGWRMHSDSYARVKASIHRLKNNSLEIATASESRGYAGSLLREYAFTSSGQDTHWWVRFEPEMAKLLMSDTTTLLEWEVRKQIGSKATLCLWLHGFYSSHREPIAFRVEKLMELCGSKSKHLPSFKRSMNTALNQLVELKFLSSFEIDNKGFVHVSKHPRFLQIPQSTVEKLGDLVRKAIK